MNDEALSEYSTSQATHAPDATQAPDAGHAPDGAQATGAQVIEAAPALQSRVEQDNQNPVTAQPAAKRAKPAARRAASGRTAAAKAAAALAGQASLAESASGAAAAEAPVAAAPTPTADEPAAMTSAAATMVEPAGPKPVQVAATPSVSARPAAVTVGTVNSSPTDSLTANSVAAIGDGQSSSPTDDQSPHPAQNDNMTRNSMDNQTTEMNEHSDGAASRSVRLPEMREDRDARPVESRGLRFRGRDGRAEVRGRVLARGRRPQGGSQGGGQNVAAPGATRDDGYADGSGNGFAANGRTGQQGGRDNNNRDNTNRDNYRDGGGRDGNNRDGNNRDGNNRDGRERVLERDIVRGRNDLDLLTLEDKNLTELREIAKDLNVSATAAMKKSDLVLRILEAQAAMSGNAFKRGILEILPDGKGFLRTEGYLPGNEDVYVSQSQIKRFNLRTGDVVSGQVRAPKEMERYYSLLRVEATNGEPPDISRQRKEFEKLTPIFPTEKFNLETSQDNITARIIDLVSPIGKGQRGLIVAPPKAGKTSLIKNVANSIALNHPEVVLIVLLIDERPEEVTDIARSVKGEVVASTFDEMPENHMRVADMVLEKAKRMVEQKKDVVILMDSITRLSRASNLVVNPSGRTMSGGLDPAAMYRPKRMFGAARNIEEGGSLTILATTLVDTGSRMDDYIFEEFKGTGNLDLVLDRNLFDQRIFPAIDINKSGTRRDDLLMSKEDLAATFHLRRTLAALDNDKAINLLIDRLKNTKTNADFMEVVRKSMRNSQTQ